MKFEYNSLQLAHTDRLSRIASIIAGRRDIHKSMADVYIARMLNGRRRIDNGKVDYYCLAELESTFITGDKHLYHLICGLTKGHRVGYGGFNHEDIAGGVFFNRGERFTP